MNLLVKDVILDIWTFLMQPGIKHILQMGLDWVKDFGQGLDGSSWEILGSDGIFEWKCECFF